MKVLAFRKSVDHSW